MSKVTLITKFHQKSLSIFSISFSISVKKELFIIELTGPTSTTQTIVIVRESSKKKLINVCKNGGKLKILSYPVSSYDDIVYHHRIRGNEFMRENIRQVKIAFIK